MDPRANPGSFSCFLIGESSLLVQCAELLLERGHRVHGLVSPTPALRRWAADHGVPAIDFGPDLETFLGATPFDYLFSITNRRLLPPAVLALPRILAINFHDALLPRHAGLFATTWAILNGESRHGVTWHVMVKEADSGSILKQCAVAVDATDTTYTLNLKCFEAGIESFAELAAELATGRATPVTQDLRLRTYHGRFERLPRGGIFSWQDGAEELDAAVRACDFGTHPNEFGTVKLALGRELIIVREIGVRTTHSGAPPGTVIELSAGGATVATTSQDVCLTSLATLAGETLTPADLADRWAAGDPTRSSTRFCQLEAAQAGRVTAACAATCRHEAFWVERLARLEACEVPYRDPAARAPASHHEIPIPTEFQKLQAAGDPARPSTWLLAALLAFLSRITGEERFDVGLWRRTQPEACDRLDQLFAFSVPLRAPALGEGRSLAQLRKRVARKLKALDRHRTYLRDTWARYPQLAAHRALAHGLPIAVELVEDLGVAGAPRPETALLVQISHRGDACRWLVAENVLPGDVAEAMCARFAAFLRAAAGPAGRDMARIPLLSAHDRRRILGEWNTTAADYPRDLCAPQLFIEQSCRRPDATAVIFEDRTLTYGELDRRSSRLAAFLDRHGIGPGSLVGLYMERTADLVVGLLGILRAGAAYVPLDPIYPPERIAWMLADTRLPLLLTQASLEPNVQGCEATVVALDRSWDTIAATGGDQPHGRATPENRAYVIFTSGSTGRPKGVEIAHRGLTNLLCSVARTPGFAERDKLLAVTTICFDIAALELFLPLVTGGVVEVAAARVAADGFELSQRIAERRPTVIQATPATWKMLIAAGWAGAPGLRVLCGGEALPRDLADGLCGRAGEVWNLYGPTETTIWSSLSAVEPGQRITIGRPIANTRFFVLDQRLQTVPPGVPGELYIGGDGVAAGYLNRPELTRQKFLPSPIGEEDGVLYRTGDLVRYLQDGRLEYLNRVDNQVKLHGYRIELGEIEHVLCKHPTIREAVVSVFEAAPGDSRLAAYLVASEPRDIPSMAEIRRHLKAFLPDYMVPAALTTMERIPLTPNGKVDRRALPPPTAIAGTGAAPGTEVEHTIAAIWGSVLRLERVGIDNKFLEVGGNSLLLMQVVKHLKARFCRSLTGVDMFRYPTIREMARFLTGTAQDSPGEDAARTGDRAPSRQRQALDELRRKRLGFRRSRVSGR